MSLTGNSATLDVTERKIKTHASLWEIYLLGVGIGACGSFFGWNYALSRVGYGGMLLATVFVFAMFWTSCLSVAELSAHQPEAGGSFRFAEKHLGVWFGVITAMADLIKIISLLSNEFAFVAHLLSNVLGMRADTQFLWVGVVAVFVTALNFYQSKSLVFPAFLTLFSLGVLAFYLVVVAPHFESSLLFTVQPQGYWFPHGAGTFFLGIPNAMWFVMGIEMLPFSAEDARDASVVIPKATNMSLLTLTFTSLCTLTLTCGVGLGTAGIGHSHQPLVDALKGIGSPHWMIVFLVLALGFAIVAGASLLLFSNARLLFGLSASGMLPKFISHTAPFGSPWVAVLTTTFVSLSLYFFCHFVAATYGWNTFALLINISVLGFMISMVCQLLAYLKHKKTHIVPYLPLESQHPPEELYCSPLGAVGGAVALLLVLTSVTMLLVLSDIYRFAMVPVVCLLLFALIYYQCWGSHRHV